jgi:ABC-type branched-subunit amino acid transport system substrate-binding protein
MMRSFFCAIVACLISPTGLAQKEYGPGVTDTEIRVGQTMPYSGPASAYATCGISHQRFFKSINDQGGINGRKIKLISLDDQMTPPQTVDRVRRLVEHDKALVLFGVLGPGALAILNYVDKQHVPFLFPSAAAGKFHLPDKHPWTMGWVPSFEFEGRMFARYILANRPNAKIGILWEDNDIGREERDGFRMELGAKAARMVVADERYLLTDPTVSSQIISIKGAGADTIVSIVTPKFAAQAIRKIHDLGWQPMHLMTYAGSAINTLESAGLDKSKGLISAYFAKTVTDPAMREDGDVKQYHAWKAKYYPEGDVNDGCIDYGYIQAHLLVQVLKQCGDDLTRENVIRQAKNLRDVRLPLLVPGITINTSPTDYRPIEALQFQRFDGSQWIFFGEPMTEK